MKGFLPLFNIAAFLLVTGCSSYETVLIRKAVIPPGPLVLTADADMDEDDAQRIITGLRYYESPRLLTTEGSNDVHSKILEAGVHEAVSGNLQEAEIIFLELRGKEKNGSVENNLGVVYEKSGRDIEAFSMYTLAVQSEPGSSLYRKNLFLFVSSGGLSKKKGTEKKRKQNNA